jgi:hypothetical protein
MFLPKADAASSSWPPAAVLWVWDNGSSRDAQARTDDDADQDLRIASVCKLAEAVASSTLPPPSSGVAQESKQTWATLQIFRAG